MQRINFWFGLALAITVVLGLSGNQTLRAQDALKAETVIRRANISPTHLSTQLPRYFKSR